MTLAYALPKTGHPNCRRPDKVIDARHLLSNKLEFDDSNLVLRVPLFKCEHAITFRAHSELF